jgi:hypothetical protein
MLNFLNVEIRRQHELFLPELNTLFCWMKMPLLTGLTNYETKDGIDSNSADK